jgi:hypothetical protein
MINNFRLLKINLSIYTVCVLVVSCSSGSIVPANPPTTTFTAFNCPDSNNVSFPGVSGIRGVTGSATDVYVTGVYVQYGGNHAFLYKGPVLGGGVCSRFNYPSSSGITVTSTSLYGPDNNGTDTVTVTGSYTTLESGPIAQQGLLYQGAADGSTLDGYSTLYPSSLTEDTIINTLGHSTMNGIVVGNYDTNLATGKAFIYDINNHTYYPLDKPGGTASITAYGIWYNGGTSYTIAGGYSAVESGGTNIGFITDWDSVTHEVSNFTTLNYNNLEADAAGTHFEGITTDDNGGYNLAADWQYIGQSQTSPAFAHITRNSDGSFALPTWTAFAYYPGSSWTSANTVYKNYILGLFQSGNPVVDSGYVATIPTN